MTSNTTPSGIAFASSTAGGGTAWGVFDQNGGTYWQSGATNSGFIGYQFPSGKIIKQYAIFTAATIGSNPKDWTFQGSNDGSTYTTIETVTGFSSVASTWYVRNVSSNTTSYTYYRMNITAVQTLGVFPLFYELQMTESTGSIYGAIGSDSIISTDGISITASNPLYGVTAGGVSSALLVTGSHTVYLSGSVRGGAAGTIRGIQIVNNGNLYVTGSVTGGTLPTLAYGIFNNAGRLEILGDIFGGANTTAHGVAIANGTTIITGNLYASANAAPIVTIAGSGSLTITGSTIITTNAGQATAVYTNGGTGIVNILGNVQAHNVGGIVMLGPCTIILTGSLTAGYTAVGISSTVASTINVTGPIFATNGYPGISSTSTTATVRVSGPLINAPNGTNAVYSPKIQLLSTSTPTYTIETDTFPKEVTFYDAAYTSSLPAQTNVRSASLYGGSNEFSGSMSVPSASNVRYGVPVDATTGSAANIIPQDLFDYAVTSLTGSNTIGERLKNISTTQTMAATIAAFKGK